MTDWQVIEGYGSLFGVEDLSGDVVEAGAFARSLRTRGLPRLLVQHQGLPVGQWVRAAEDGKGLFLRGRVRGDVLRSLGEARGLSIGFVARDWSARPDRGRRLKQLELLEVSLVHAPMLPDAGFSLVGGAGVARGVG